MSRFTPSRRAALTALPALAAAASLPPVAGALATPRPDSAVTRHRTMQIDGIEIFYREAGPADAPALLLLHGFPTSSRMFRNLIPALADRYRLIAPDYPGFGHSAAPARKDFTYSFANYANIVDTLTARLGLARYGLYVQDYGAPVGFRLALKRPERISALIVQNGNAYDEGLREFWAPLKTYWAQPSAANREALRGGLTLEATRAQYVEGLADPSRIDPDNWLIDHALLARPGLDEVYLDLFRDYGSNVALYPQFQAFFRTRKPPTLIAWGRNDFIFPAEGAHPYLRDIPEAELHLLDSGHFALEDKSEEITALMREFLGRRLARG
jgi:pimeloyl-ACP methyl ester carboxylesterase